MPTQGPSINMETMLPQLTQVDSFIRAFALRVLSTTVHENLWDMTNRVCDRYLARRASPLHEGPALST
jgi:hypothetical protein